MTVRAKQQWLKYLLGAASGIALPAAGWGAVKAIDYVTETRAELEAHESLSDHAGTAIRLKYIEESLHRLEAQNEAIYKVLVTPK